MRNRLHISNRSNWATKTIATVVLTMSVTGITLKTSLASDFVVYSVYQALNLGNAGEVSEKDYYVNMGTADGLRDGAVLDVSRKVATYDLLSEKLYKDLVFPIGRLRVIHAESNAAVARLDKLLPVERAPALSNRAVMVGDLVKVSK